MKAIGRKMPSVNEKIKQSSPLHKQVFCSCQMLRNGGICQVIHRNQGRFPAPDHRPATDWQWMPPAGRDSGAQPFSASTRSKKLQSDSQILRDNILISTIIITWCGSSKFLDCRGSKKPGRPEPAGGSPYRRNAPCGHCRRSPDDTPCLPCAESRSNRSSYQHCRHLQNRRFRRVSG